MVIICRKRRFADALRAHFSIRTLGADGVGWAFCASRLSASGEIILENGDPYTDPDEAATAVAGRRMDGWKNWRTSDGTRLGELRQ